MPVTNDSELDEALTLLESEEVEPGLKSSVRRAVQAYQRAMPTGAPSSTMAPVGIDAIDAGREEFGLPLAGGIGQIPKAPPAGSHAAPSPPPTPENLSFDELSIEGQGPLPQKLSELLGGDLIARTGGAVTAGAQGLAEGVLPGSSEFIRAGADKLMPGAGDALEAFRDEHTMIGGAAEFVGAANPYGIESAIARGVTKSLAPAVSGVAGKAFSRLSPGAASGVGNVAGSVVGSGVAAGAGQAMREVSKQVAQGEDVTVPEHVLEMAMVGGAFGGLGETLGMALGRIPLSTREGRMGPEIERVERAGGALGVTGIKPGPAMAKAQDDALRIGREEGRIVSPVDVALENVTKPVARTALKRQAETVGKVADETAAYHEGAKGVTLESEELLKSGLEELKRRSFSDGGALPAQRASTDTIRKKIIERLMEPELVPATQADEFARKGAIVMDPDELSGLGIDAGALAARATVRGAPAQNLSSPETAAGRFLDSHPNSAALRSFLNVERKAVSEAQIAGAASPTGEAVQRVLEDAKSSGLAYGGRVFRGAQLDDAQLARAIQTGELQSDRIWSVSPEEQMASSFATKRTSAVPGRSPVLFEIDQSSAVPVSGMTGQDTFEELLLPRGKRFQVTGSEKRNGVTVLRLSETEGPVATAAPMIGGKLEPMGQESLAGAAALFGRPIDDAFVTKLVGHDQSLPPATYRVFSDEAGGGFGQHARVVAEYATPKGQVSMVRAFRREGDSLVAEQVEIRIPEAMRGEGLGKRLLAQQVTAYDELGVKRIEMIAADQGRAVWPIMGFELSDPTDFPRIRKKFDEYIVSKGVSPATVPASDIRQVARYVDPATGVDGREFLLSKDFAPHYMDLTADLTGETGTRLRSYLGIGRGRGVSGDPLVNDPARAASSSAQANTSSMMSAARSSVGGTGEAGAGGGASGMGMPQGSSADGPYKVVLRARQLSTEELDQVAGDIDAARKVESASTSQYDPFYDTAANSIRRIRDTAPMVRGVADESTMADVYDAQGGTTTVRGLSGLKARQSAELGDMQDDFEGAGLPRQLPAGKTRVVPPGDQGPLSPQRPVEDPTPDLSVKEKEAFNTRVLDYERTPGMEGTRYRPLRKLAEAAGVRKELDNIPGITAWQNLQGRAAAGQAARGVITGSGVSGYVSTGAADFARLRLDSPTNALGGVPGALELGEGARRELAEQLSPALLRLLKRMRKGEPKRATGTTGGVGTQVLGLRGGPFGARAAAALSDEDVENLAELVQANQEQEQQ